MVDVCTSCLVTEHSACPSIGLHHHLREEPIHLYKRRSRVCQTVAGQHELVVHGLVKCIPFHVDRS